MSVLSLSCSTLRAAVAVLTLCAVVSCEDSCVPVGEGEGESSGEGEDPRPLCIIGDPTAPAQLSLVFRSVPDENGDVTVEDVVDDGEIPMILPPQAGKVILVGVRGTNVTCNLSLSGGVYDLCPDPPRVIHTDGRPVTLAEVEPGAASPADPQDLTNYLNIPTCPTFSSTRDGEGQPTGLEVRVTEVIRPGEDAPRTHTLSATIVPVCGEPEFQDDCRCECDADFNTDLSREEQCPTINDNDLGFGECPVAPG